MNLHRRGVYHNDFAMENIMIGFLKQGQMSYGEGDVVVLDFGASRAAERAKREVQSLGPRLCFVLCHSAVL